MDATADDARFAKGAADAMRAFVESSGRQYFRRRSRKTVDEISRRGGTPLVVAEGHEVARRRRN